jgi:hypothetical protein
MDTKGLTQAEAQEFENGFKDIAMSIFNRLKDSLLPLLKGLAKNQITDGFVTATLGKLGVPSFVASGIAGLLVPLIQGLL